MSRTKRFNLNPFKWWYGFRSPKGAKQAQVLGLRHVPPTSWDDIPIGREAVKQSMRLMKQIPK